MLAVIYGLKQIAEDGLGWAPLLPIAAGLAVGLAFVRRQARLADPLIDLKLFRDKAFSTALTTNVLGFFATFGMFLFMAQYLQLVLGLSPLEAGLWSLPSSLGFVAGAMLTAAARAGVPAGGRDGGRAAARRRRLRGAEPGRRARPRSSRARSCSRSGSRRSRPSPPT